MTTLEAPADEVIFDEEEEELEPPDAELTADEVFDEEEEPPELDPAGLRGGKRKR